jgi:hypothetical protein
VREHRHVSLRAFALLVLSCAPSTKMTCDDLGARWCQRLWLCVTEHSRANADFIARYGRSPSECTTLYSTACEAAFTCPLTDATARRCGELTAQSACTELEAARADCVSTCSPP